MAVQRKSMLGIETELFTLTEEGKLIAKADDLLKLTKDTKISKLVKPEFSTCMVEIAADAGRSIKQTALGYMETLGEFIEIAENMNVKLLPLGTHPGRGKIKFVSKTWYDAQRAILGDENVSKQGKISGFHFHHTLPEGIVHKDTQLIRNIKRSTAKDVFLQQYNFMIAADPAAITFCQSTPFWFGTHYGNDCRVLSYRDFRTKKDNEHVLEGIYYYHPIFGTLPPYEYALQDVRVLAEQRKTQWLRSLENIKFPTNEIATAPTLKFVWGPLRVNKIGTLEYRGPDMNHPDVLFSVSSLLRFILIAIEEKELEVYPSDIGATEPFTLEDNVIYLPPNSSLRQLQYQSAKGGLNSKEVYTYCKRLFALASKLTKKSEMKNLARVKEMLNKKKTISDEILDMVKKNGYNHLEDLPEDILNHVALYHADKLVKSVDKLKKTFSSFSK